MITGLCASVVCSALQVKEPVTLFGPAIPTPYAMSGHLRLGTEGVPYIPMQETERLVLIKQKEKMVVKFPKLLKGGVTLRSAADTLSYLRLFSNPRSTYMFKYAMGVEVRSREDVDKAWFMNDETLFAFRNRMGEGMMGLLSKKVLSNLGCKPPTVRSGHRFWEVERFMMKRSNDSKRNWYLSKVVERVTTDGGYTLVSSVSWKPKSSAHKVIWRMPPLY